MHQRKLARLVCFIVVFSTLIAKAQKVPLKITNYPIPTTGVVIYAAPEDAYPTPGEVTNTGTGPSSPWTLTKALLSAPANATVIVRGGEYRALSQNRITNKITIQAYPGEEPWIKGSIVVTNWEKVAGQNIWVHPNWPYQFPRSTIPENIGTNPLCDNRDMIYINDRSLKQVDSIKNVGAGTFYVDYAGDKLYVGTDPATGRVESTRFGSPIIRNDLSGTEVRVPNGTTIKGIGFTHYADNGLELVCAGGLNLEDNTFSWNGTAGAKLVAPAAIIRGNTFAFNGNVGLSGNNLKETIVEYNHAYENNIEAYSTSWAAAGIKVIVTKNMKMRRNLVENNYSAGIWLDISAIDNELSYNTVRENGGFGIFSELSNGTLIAGNLLIDNKNYCIALSDTDSSEVWNNTIVSNAGRGFFIKDSPRESKNAVPGSLFYSYIIANSKECSWVTRANVIKNNIVVTNTGLWMENTQPSELQIRETDFNGYYRTGAADINIYKWSNVNYKTLDAFKAAIPGYEVHSIAFYQQSANPFFSDTTYRLVANSPAIKAGTPLPANIAALLGLPANGQPVDMGAIQTIAPAAPADLAAVAVSQTQINLTWADNADNETGFVIEKKSASDSIFTVIDTVAANSTGYSSTGLTANTMYTYRVMAYNTSNNSAYTNDASATTFLPNSPAAPTNLIATVLSQRTVTLSWIDNAENEEGYKVERSTMNGEFVTVAALGANASSYKDTALTASTNYIYKITGFNKGGTNSSNEQTVTTAAAGTGLLAHYYKNTHFKGSSFTRTDATVDFNWGPRQQPPPGIITPFSVRWEGQLEAIYSEMYTFKTITDDGVRLWVNGQLIIDNFTSGGLRENTGKMTLEADKKYAIKLEYYQNDSKAVAKLLWSCSTRHEDIVPQAQLYPALSASSGLVIKSEPGFYTVFPNPAKDDVKVAFESTRGEAVEIIIADKQYKQVLSYKGVTVDGENVITLNISKLKPGLYFLIKSVNGERNARQLVIVK